MSGTSNIRLLSSPELIEKQRNGALVLDVRPAEEFAKLHIRGSVQIGLHGSFASWAALLLKPSQPLVLVAGNLQDAHEALARLARVGLGKVLGYVTANEAQWREQGLQVASISVQRCDNVRKSMGTDRPIQLLDVRSYAEWVKGHLPGAIFVPLLDLESSIQSIDPAKPSLVYCREGYRATTAASILLRKSYGACAILIDGFEGWTALGLPVEVPEQK